jgi:hypothetical protein
MCPALAVCSLCHRYARSDESARWRRRGSKNAAPHPHQHTPYGRAAQTVARRFHGHLVLAKGPTHGAGQRAPPSLVLQLGQDYGVGLMAHYQVRDVGPCQLHPSHVQGGHRRIGPCGGVGCAVPLLVVAGVRAWAAGGAAPWSGSSSGVCPGPPGGGPGGTAPRVLSAAAAPAGGPPPRLSGGGGGAASPLVVWGPASSRGVLCKFGMEEECYRFWNLPHEWHGPQELLDALCGQGGLLPA